MKYVLVGAVLLWIAYDVGSGALMGVSKARHEQLASMPMADLLQTVAGNQKVKVGSEWIRHGVLSGAYVGDNTLIQNVKLTRKTRKELQAKWSRGWDTRAKHSIVKKTCGDARLRLLLDRRARVVYRISDQNDVFVLQVSVRKSQCA